MDQHHHHNNQDHEQHQKPYKDHHHHHQQAPIIQDHNHPSPKKQQQSKRDEWSEGAVTTLLEAYESKWTLRNRAKLKGQDWEDVARIVSSRAGSTKSVKTLTQCKNKIESMKKRYRSESAAAADEASSSWPLYSRIDSLLRGSNSVGVCCGKDDVAVEAVAPPPRPVVLERPEERESGGGGDHEMGKENNIDDVIPKPAYPESEKIVRIGENDSINTPVERQSTRPKAKAKRAILKQRIRRRGDFCEVAESIRWLAEALIRSEQSRMEKMKEIEKMRVEAEAKRSQIDLKMTEIIANTQLEIARIFADVIKRPSSSGDSSMKIGRSS